MPMDSAGKVIHVGDRVMFRGQTYTIKAFDNHGGRYGTRVIKFKEPQHVEEVADEISVDLIQDIGEDHV